MLQETDPPNTAPGAGELVIDPGPHVSVGLNPLPETVTMMPVGPALGLRVIVGEGVVRVNMA